MAIVAGSYVRTGPDRQEVGRPLLQRCRGIRMNSLLLSTCLCCVGLSPHCLSFAGNLEESNRQNFSTDLLFNVNDNWRLGLGHRSEILNVDRLELQTNSYLHTFFVPVHWLSQSDKASVRFSIAPALSASSKSLTVSGSSASCSMTSATSMPKPADWSQFQTRSVQMCFLCDRNHL